MDKQGNSCFENIRKLPPSRDTNPRQHYSSTTCPVRATRHSEHFRVTVSVFHLYVFMHGAPSSARPVAQSITTAYRRSTPRDIADDMLMGSDAAGGKSTMSRLRWHVAHHAPESSCVPSHSRCTSQDTACCPSSGSCHDHVCI